MRKVLAFKAEAPVAAPWIWAVLALPVPRSLVADSDVGTEPDNYSRHLIHSTSQLVRRATTTCGSNSNTASGRTIGYYQVSNLQRLCDTVTVSEIDTSGLSHLYAAAVID